MNVALNAVLWMWLAVAFAVAAVAVYVGVMDRKDGD